MSKYRHFDRKIESPVHRQKVKNIVNYRNFATFGQNCAYKMVGRTLQILIKYGKSEPLTDKPPILTTSGNHSTNTIQPTSKQFNKLDPFWTNCTPKYHIDK